MRSALIAAAAALALSVAAPASAQLLGTDGGWGGPYVGLTPGVKLGDAIWTATQLNGGGVGGTPFTAVDASSPRTYSFTAARLGGYAGINWQSAAGWSVPRPALRGQTRKRRGLFCR